MIHSSPACTESRSPYRQECRVWRKEPARRTVGRISQDRAEQNGHMFQSCDNKFSTFFLCHCCMTGTRPASRAVLSFSPDRLNSTFWAEICCSWSSARSSLRHHSLKTITTCKLFANIWRTLRSKSIHFHPCNLHNNSMQQLPYYIYDQPTSQDVLVVFSTISAALSFPRGWDGINYWYWCRHCSKVCWKAHRLPSKAFRQFGQ